MKKVTVTTSTMHTLEYDPESKEFQDALADYRDCIDSTADASNVLRQIGFTLTQQGGFAVSPNQLLIEGLGFVSDKGVIPEEGWCGVNLLDEDTDSDIA